KTVTLQRIAERLSAIGVPVFMADVKGDLAGLSQAGELSPKLKARLESLKLDAPKFAGCPVTFWDVFGQQGSPVRATVAEMGPLLLSRVLELTTRRKASSRCSSRSAMTMDCCCSISRICAPRCSSSAKTRSS